jgi:hypothetical protein
MWYANFTRLNNMGRCCNGKLRQRYIVAGPQTRVRVRGRRWYIPGIINLISLAIVDPDCHHGADECGAMVMAFAVVGWAWWAWTFGEGARRATTRHDGVPQEVSRKVPQFGTCWTCGTCGILCGTITPANPCDPTLSLLTIQPKNKNRRSESAGPHYHFFLIYLPLKPQIPGISRD